MSVLAGHLPPVPLDVATEPTIPYPWFDRTYTGRRIAPVMESADGLVWASTRPLRFCYYPPRELSAEEAAALAERLRAGVEAVALSALDEPLQDDGATSSLDHAVDAVSAYLDAELGPAGEPGGDAGDHFARTYLLDFMTAAAAQLQAALAAAPKKRGGADLIAFTAPPVAALEQAVADAAGARSYFALVDGNRRLVWARGKAGYQVAVDYTDPVASVDEALREIGERNGLEAVFTVAAACYHALEHEGEPVHADDVLLDIGWQRNRDGAREERADAVDRTAGLYLLLNGWNVIGESWGTFTDKSGRRLDVSSRGPLFTTTVLDDPQGTLLGRPAPVGFVFRCGDFLARAREQPHVLATFGTYRALARMPRQRPADAWAVAVGLALIQRWRELSRHAKVTTPGDANRPAIRVQRMTRRYLLSQYPPRPTAEAVLADKDHGVRNAKTYWTKALHALRVQSVIDADVERRLAGKPAKLPRHGWRAAWLDEPLDARPPENYRDAFLTLAERAEIHAKKTRRPRRRKP